MEALIYNFTNYPGMTVYSIGSIIACIIVLVMEWHTLKNNKDADISVLAPIILLSWISVFFYIYQYIMNKYNKQR